MQVQDLHYVVVKQTCDSWNTFVRRQADCRHRVLLSRHGDRWAQWVWEDGASQIALCCSSFISHLFEKTIIECLKYATTGDQPPNTRGGAFVHDPKMANEKEVKAQVKLRFNAANGVKMLAVRNLSVTMKKTGAMTMKTLESLLGLAEGNPDRGGKVCTWLSRFVPSSIRRM